MSRAALAVAFLLLAAIALPGCALLAVPALGSAASSGAGALVRAGASSIKGDTVYRTFDASLPDVYAAVESTLSRLEFPDPEVRGKQERVTLRTAAIERQVRIEFQPITPTLTQISVTVASGVWHKDPATAATLVDLIAEAVGPRPAPIARPAP